MCPDEWAEGEDVVTELDSEYENLPAIVDMLEARNSKAPLPHKKLGDKFPKLSKKCGNFFNLAKK